MSKQNNPIHVFNEIGKLKTVLVKRPGREVENLYPDIMERLLFDDIPHLPVIQKEHDEFVEILRDNDVEVLYFEKLAAEAIDAGDVKEQFLIEMLDESNITSRSAYDALKEYLLAMDTQEMVDTIMAGVRKDEVELESNHLVDISDEEDYPFYMDPMPNLYFTRDPAATMGNGITLNKMAYPARQRESLFSKYVLDYHPRFAGKDIPVWRDRDEEDYIEGGDELILSPKALAIGISQRTSAQAIEDLAIELFKRNAGFEKVLAIKIPNVRAMMHLDTVFTMIDYDKFTIHPGILRLDGSIDTYILEKGDTEDTVKISHNTNLKETLEEALEVENIQLIPCGGGDPVAAPREQWNDGSNTLTLAPGVVLTYDRNYVSNELLREAGVKVLEMSSSEISRGRGGPRCMSMPIIREDI